MYLCLAQMNLFTCLGDTIFHHHGQEHRSGPARHRGHHLLERDSRLIREHVPHNLQWLQRDEYSRGQFEQRVRTRVIFMKPPPER